MTRKIILLICVLLTVFTVAYAGIETIKKQEIKEEVRIEDGLISDDTVNIDLFSAEIEQKISGKVNLKKPEEFKVIMDGCERAVYNNVAEYTDFICTYDFTEDELKVINRILNSGTTIQSLVQVYEFWLTTDEEFSIIEEICALEDDFFSEYWYENAFNLITDYSHGVLNAEDVQNYLAQGITEDEIMSANILSRKDGQNIEDILSKLIGGESLETQAKQIYGVDTLPEDEYMYRRILVLSQTANEKLATYGMNSEINAVNTNRIKEITEEAITLKIDTELERLNIEEPESDMEGDYEKLKSSKYPISVQRTLINKGYTPDEILLASLQDEDNINIAAKKAREAFKNE